MRIAIPTKNGRGPKTKRVKLPPPTRLLYGHGIITAVIENGKVLAEGRVGLVIEKPAIGTVEAHAVDNQILQAHFDAAKAMCKWPVNAEVDVEVFLAAIETAANAKVR